ncbi:MAG: DUF423 domain-containing protein [Xanthomonadaceae bacterium]|nr:DUF423 domain-containing protein [Xanthomonadaceae bacterium]
MNKKSIVLGATNGFLAVAIGAFGAHALGPILNEHTKVSFETGSKYHFYHALALLFTGLMTQIPKWIPLAFTFGILLFSGSLYALAITKVSAFGFFTPLGGILFLSGWLGVLWQAQRLR